MTQSVLGSRKRGRVEGDEESRDFTPLSKRINNLHINNGAYYSRSDSPHHENGPGSPPEGDHCWDPANNGASCSSNSSSSSGSSNSNCSSSISSTSNSLTGVGGMVHQHLLQSPLYSPNLTISDNPIYYEPNKLLYYLYVERMQRSGQHF